MTQKSAGREDRPGSGGSAVYAESVPITNSRKGFPTPCWWWRPRPPVQDTKETRVRSLGREDPLEEGMAPHSRVLAWRIPWTQEPGGLCGVAKSRTRLSGRAGTAEGRKKTSLLAASLSARLLQPLLTCVTRRRRPQTDAPLSWIPPPSLPPAWPQKCQQMLLLGFHVCTEFPP